VGRKGKEGHPNRFGGGEGIGRKEKRRRLKTVTLLPKWGSSREIRTASDRRWSNEGMRRGTLKTSKGSGKI